MLTKRYETVTLGGEQFVVCFDMRALESVERLTGKDALAALQEVAAGRVRAVTDVLWAEIDAAAAAREEPCPVTREKLPSLISDLGEFSVAGAVALDLFIAFVGEVSPKANGSKPKGKASRSRPAGSTSSGR